jgi:hypothetical protein
VTGERRRCNEEEKAVVPKKDTGWIYNNNNNILTGCREVHEISQGLAIVEPTIACTGTRLPPNEASFICEKESEGARTLVIVNS